MSLKEYKVFFYLFFSIFVIALIYISAIAFHHYSLRKQLSQAVLIQPHQQSSLYAPPSHFLPPKKIPPNKLVRILVLQGGGARGIVSSKVLAYMEKVSGKPISELFDVMAGVSVGSLEITALSLQTKDHRNIFTANKLSKILEKDAPKALKPSLRTKLLSGFGLISPIINTANYRKLLHHHFGDATLSNLANNVLYFSYNQGTGKISTFTNRDNSKENFNLAEFIASVTSIPGIMPVIKIKSINTHNVYALSDATFVVNSPMTAALLYVNSLYPKNPKILTFVGDGIYPGTQQVDYASGLLSEINNYEQMLWLNRNGIDKMTMGKISEEKAMNLQHLFLIDTHVSTPACQGINSHKNCMILHQKTADKMIAENKSKIQELISLLIRH